MQKPCQDSYYTLFSSYPTLLDYHEEQAKNSRWIRCKVADLQVEPLGESSPLIGNLPAFAAGTSQEAVKDTAENLGLAMRVNGELYPVRMTAYKSLLDRAKIGGTALSKLSREVLAEVLNECLKLYSADALLLIRDEKISAVHSGDEVDYSVLPIDELLKVLQAKLDARFSGNEFESGYCDHSLVSASWRMPDQKEDLRGTYAKVLAAQGKATMASNQPMRNFLFRGEAGTGKTMGAQAIAAGLNLPYTLMTCSANTEITDLVGQFIPDTNGFHGSTPIEDLPKISDITMHPPSVYMMLTGEYDESKTEDDVLQKLIEIAVGNLMEKEDPAGQRIRYVDTPLVEAIRHGYVCELQEPSCIANPGVLVGLNSLLDNCQVITLPTGERVRRHPDTVIVVTTNSDYSGCRDMNQSVISRMDLIYDMEAPDLNTMVKRVMNVTGFTDEQEATKMAIVVRDIAERCRQTMITDGSCGMREFKSWVLSTMVTNDPYESALSTIISSASADPDNRAELISACLEPQYSKTI